MKRCLSTCLAAALILVGASGCKDGPEAEEGGGGARATSGDEREWPVDDRGRCEATGPNREVSEYDTSGDDHPDVRKVFVIVGEGPAARMVLMCREADLNDDGYKDVVRRYDEDGRPTREEADRDFDGRIDEITFYEEGRIGRRELDGDNDGLVDTKTFYDENGEPLRTERDVSRRSTPEHWRPDRWEYYEAGRTVRVGSDLDGDGRVDRWDRDSHRNDPRASGDTEAGEAEATEDEVTDGEVPDEELAGEETTGEEPGGEPASEDAPTTPDAGPAS